MSFADRQKRLRIVQQVHDQWWREHPEIEPGEAGSDEQEAELLKRIDQALAEAKKEEQSKGSFGQAPT